MTPQDDLNSGNTEIDFGQTIRGFVEGQRFLDDTRCNGLLGGVEWVLCGWLMTSPLARKSH